jgi:hypothetical protein
MASALGLVVLLPVSDNRRSCVVVIGWPGAFALWSWLVRPRRRGCGGLVVVVLLLSLPTDG